MESFLPAVLSIVHGCWSDKHGRKLSMIISAVGMLLSYMILFALTYYPAYCNRNLWLLLLPSIPSALGGGLPVFQMATFSYLGNILRGKDARPKEKLYRFLICEACFLFGGPIGLFVSGVLFNSYGHRIVFLMAGMAGCRVNNKSLC